jgi:hypothetical protein
MTILEATFFALMVLCAVGIGAAVPALLELRRTIKVFRERFDEGADKVAPLLDQLDRTTASLQRVSHLLDVTASVSQAVAPAVAAFISTWRATPSAQLAPDDMPRDTPGDTPGDTTREKSSNGNGNGMENTT